MAEAKLEKKCETNFEEKTDAPFVFSIFKSNKDPREYKFNVFNRESYISELAEFRLANPDFAALDAIIQEFRLKSMKSVDNLISRMQNDPESPILFC